jgi:putative endonuclease
VSYVVYILQSEKSGQYYIGQTSDLKERLRRHTEGRVRATKGATPWMLIYTEEFVTRGEAVRREREIKSKKNRAFIDRLIESTRGVAQPG